MWKGIGSDMASKKCKKCGCHTGTYHIIYDIPGKKKVDLCLCRPCQMMMVNLIGYAQGLQKDDDDE